MGWRTVVIENGHRVSLYLSNLKIESLEGTYLVPLDDIDVLIFNNYKMSITTQLLRKLSAYNVCTIVCEKNGMPGVITNSLTGHSMAYKHQKLQLNQLDFMKAKLWMQLIHQKILNQAFVLDKFTRPLHTIEILLELANTVCEDDSTNREGLAAKSYFRGLFGDGFIREHESDDPVNIALNYGYAVIRAMMARTLVGKGLLLSIGLKHKNMYNHFNLVDDCMEVYRPIIDLWVYESLWKEQNFFTREKKLELLQFISEAICYHNNKKFPISLSMNQLADSLIRCLDSKQEHLDLPILMSD